MIDVFNALSDLISTKVRKAIRPHRIRQSLKVAVLGPNLGRDDLGSQKRRQIFCALKNDGHTPFFPENQVDSDSPFESILTQECILLSDTRVDLVIILYTETSFGVSQEIARFEGHPEIKVKTGILFPRRFYEEEGVPSDTVQNYLVNHPYTDSQLEKCQVVGWCRRWAFNRQTGMWPTLTPHKF